MASIPVEVKHVNEIDAEKCWLYKTEFGVIAINSVTGKVNFVDGVD